ncbi:MAG: GNAT family N-acetyltransferase [Methanobacterium sp.]|jgi:GNAT superfamily N-acetyltransferase|nr:GNAT family N-acetyltransferase [Methanobacterium sp.]
MPIKTIKDHFSSNPLKNHFENNSLKEHFSSNHLKNHWTYFFQDNMENKVLEQFYDYGGLEFRRFSWKDLDECAQLFKSVFSTDPWYDEWISLDQVKNYLKELIENPVFEGFVVCENSNVVAVCLGHRRSGWMGKEFFVDEFFVENRRQGGGIGTKTLNFVGKILFNEGYTRLTLLTNKGIFAESFYLKNGFYNNEKRTIMVKEF